MYDHISTLDTSVTGKGSEISIETNPDSDVLTPETQIIQVTYSNNNIKDVTKVQEAVENRQMSPTEENEMRAAAPATNSKDVNQIRVSAASGTVDTNDVTHNEDIVTKSPT